jgi:hypothetical protein
VDGGGCAARAGNAGMLSGATDGSRGRFSSVTANRVTHDRPLHCGHVHRKFSYVAWRHTVSKQAR